MQLKGISQLNKAVLRVQALAKEVAKSLEERRDWHHEQSEEFQESFDGEIWNKHMDAAEVLLESIEQLQPMQPEDLN